MGIKRSQKKREALREAEISKEKEKLTTILEIARKNGLVPEGIRPTFQNIDISKLYETRDFSNYIVKHSNQYNTCLSMAYGVWWGWLITQKYKGHYTRNMVVDGQTVKVPVSHVLETEEYQSKFPPLEMGPDFRTE